MIRVQVYLTSKEKQKLHAISLETHQSQSQLIREAIDLLIDHKQKSKQDKLALLQSMKGAWSDRTDLPDFAGLRQEFDRHSSRKSK